MNKIDSLKPIIHKKIEEELSQNNTSEDFNREHIFRSILKFSFANENMINKLHLIYLYQLFQKGLHHLRVDNTNTADLIFEKADNYMKKISFISLVSKEGFNILKYPYLAYFYYKNKKYSKAEELIKKSIVSINYTTKKGFSEAILAKLEQEYNLLKILLRKKQLDKAYNKAYEILKILHTNHIFLKIMSEKEYISMYKYFADKVIIEMVRFEGKLIPSILLNLYKLKYINYICNDIKSFFSLFFKNEKLKNDTNNFRLNIIPFMYQFILFNKYLKEDKVILNYLSNFKNYEKVKQYI